MFTTSTKMKFEHTITVKHLNKTTIKLLSRAKTFNNKCNTISQRTNAGHVPNESYLNSKTKTNAIEHLKLLDITNHTQTLVKYY